MNLCIAVFSFRRISTLQNLISKLEKQAKDIPLYVYIDGPLTLKDIETGNKIENILKKSILKINIIRREFNKGLSGNIVQSINELFNEYEYLIYIEDDINISDDFIDFYLKSIPYISTGKYSYVSAFNEKNIKNNHCFYGSECTTWITHKKYWINFENNSKDLLKEINKNFLSTIKKINIFNYKILVHQCIYEPQIWANNHSIFCSLKGYKTFIPKYSKANHCGTDTHATNYIVKNTETISEISNSDINFNEVNFISNKEFIPKKIIVIIKHLFKYKLYLFINNIKKKINNKITLNQWKKNNGENLRIHKGLQENDVVFEIGANDSSYVSDILYKNNRNPLIIAFEPSKYYDKYRIEDDRVVYYNYGLSNFNGKAKLSRMYEGGSIIDCKTNNQYDIIDIRKISDFTKHFNSITVLNINIEGAEYECIYDLYLTNELLKIKYLYIQFHHFNNQELFNKKIFIKNLLSSTHKISWEFDDLWTKYELL